MSFSAKISRRHFLFAGASLAAVPTLPFLYPQLLNAGDIFKLDISESNTRATERFFTALKVQGKPYISCMNLQGTELFRSELPAELHSIAANSALPNTVIGITRDPEQDALVIDTQSGHIIGRLQPGDQRHFNGHGCITNDGKYFYASENNYHKQQGSIGIYALNTQQRVAELNSFGQGPHELGLLSDQRTLVIANGGIQTLPASGRKELNTATMHPNLVYLDIQTGQLINQHELDDHQLSIRHMTIGADDTVGLALQYKGLENVPPLVGFQKGTGDITLLKSDSEKTHWQMNQYTASICIHPKTGVTAVTSPRGDVITFWNSHTHSFLKALDIVDPGGVALSRDGEFFFVTSGTGKLVHINAHTLEIESSNIPNWHQAHWGNHFTQLSV